ncbi:laccase domain-containing protein [Bathymodiolus platifrons methanotrophic gill symbiont]|uniref:peptidoglycan editing factor PgeF n=1 Tax=Bathymodiolus platifrons methanotrophic gill symbiont TaxID=113268 RepID=UPI000B4207B4|nr:peptidoglycan editing factor PgeF [Bathymodiolus platifrons methanotrophic gill symbiont]MCK5869455.1 peptidoglycan editing factor PgeF [Methyloprofundus sp.]TXK97826.1 multi-copper polyphenol oxidoreductase [Methylococcaceae bacterium CS4]TXL00380.1 multi-copper polyphenol oxidoreductase [Methylococcaceae bacterium CS5]TXL07509.1 multi-copper polyphenol oxidoreductase [Methylococcaceae bacterium CS3]TXL08074.1 multi-copper polyphenol oxidoreductase [Methylococcaceae bacterium CS1]TXL11231
MTHWITPDWPAPAYIRAATTLRTGGVSQAEFSSLNPADHVNDLPHHVLENRQRITSMLALPAEPVWLRQTHSVQVVCADQVTEPPEADASYTRKNSTVCTVLTADCLPLLLCDRQGTMVAAIHGGWRGLLNGIIENTVLKMSSTELYAWLGPAIGTQCFEVSDDVRNAFTNKSAQFASAFKKHTEDKYLADIYQIARILLNKAGVKQIYGGQYCTVTDKERFFSYRRDGQTGRMATMIWKV